RICQHPASFGFAPRFHFHLHRVGDRAPRRPLHRHRTMPHHVQPLPAANGPAEGAHPNAPLTTDCLFLPYTRRRHQQRRNQQSARKSRSTHSCPSTPFRTSGELRCYLPFAPRFETLPPWNRPDSPPVNPLPACAPPDSRPPAAPAIAPYALADRPPAASTHPAPS